MKLTGVKIHNVRSVKDALFSLSDYSVIVGANNAGKTNIITALRLFYENGKLTFSKDRDFPKFDTDGESWIELTFLTSAEEQEQLREEYRDENQLLRVRRYFVSDKGRVKPGQSNIYAYESGSLSENHFYGAKNISQAKLGSVIYIPAVSKTEDNLKTSGPSPLRDVVNLVMKKAVSSSPSFEQLSTAFESFNTDFRNEVAADGTSIKSLVKDINEEIGQWGVEFGVNFNQVKPEDLVKNLLSHHLEDTQLDGQRVNVNSFGQGLQRHLIFTVIRISARYSKRPTKKLKDFNPDFSLVLFEEPEAYLHPPQQEVLRQGLKTLGGEDGNQVIVTSHSARFISRQLYDIPSIIRVQRQAGQTSVHQVSDAKLEEMMGRNIGLAQALADLGGEEFDSEEQLAKESFEYSLWIDAERAGMFFGQHVILCEGLTERAFFSFLQETEWQDLRDRQVYFTDCGGKWSIHRFICLLTELGVNHSALFDHDKDNEKNRVISEYIRDSSTELTCGVYVFERDFETFMDLDLPGDSYKKPLAALRALSEGNVSAEKIGELRKIINDLIAPD